MNFKPIRNYDYIIFEDGDIVNTITKLGVEKFRKAQHHAFKVNLENGNGVITLQLSHLVYETFYDVIMKKGQYITHFDGNRDNLHYLNLRLGMSAFGKKEPKQLDSKKEWGSLDNYSNYKVSNYGDVYNEKTTRFLTPHQQFDKNYVTQLVNDKGKQDIIRIHRLVYQIFKRPLKEDEHVIHIDKNYQNNYIGNLKIEDNDDMKQRCVNRQNTVHKIQQYDENGNYMKTWESFKQITDVLGYNSKGIHNACSGHNQKSHGFIWKYEAKVDDISGYKTVLNDNGQTYSKYKINKKNNIINHLNILLTNRTVNDYHRVTLVSDQGNAASFLVSRLAAITFVNNPNKLSTVNHLNEIKLDNNVDNLEWCTGHENIVYSIGKTVFQYDLNDNFIQSFETTVKAANSNPSFNRTSISNVCNGKAKRAHNYKWKFAYNVRKEALQEKPKVVDIETNNIYYEITIKMHKKNKKELKYIFTYLMCGIGGKTIFPDEKEHSKGKYYDARAAIYTIHDDVLYGLIRYHPKKAMTQSKLIKLRDNATISAERIYSEESKTVKIKDVEDILKVIRATKHDGSTNEDFLQEDESE